VKRGEPKCFWFRMKRARYGGKSIEGAKWIYVQVFETNAARAKQLAKQKLRIALGHTETGLPWGGVTRFEEADSLVARMGVELKAFEHPHGGVVFMRGFA
jgi:hypothetical protein